MSCRGKVANGVVVLEQAHALPEGAEVRVELVRGKHPKKVASLADKLRAWGGGAKGLPWDLARNHDHYLYGVPKK